MNIGIKTTAPERAIWICVLRLNFYLVGSCRLCATEKVLSPGCVQKIGIKGSRSCSRFCGGWYVGWLCVGWSYVGRLCMGGLFKRWPWLKIVGWFLRLWIDFGTSKCTGILIIRVFRTHALSCEQMDFPWRPHCHFCGLCCCYSCRSCLHLGGRWWNKNAIWSRTRLYQFWSVAVNDFTICITFVTIGNWNFGPVTDVLDAEIGSCSYAEYILAKCMALFVSNH